MSNNTPLFTTVYRIPRETYQRFNLALTMKSYEKNVKKTTRQGLVELAVAVAVTLWVLSQPQKPQIVILLCVALMGLGLYSLTFYRHIFPRALFRTAGEKYDKSNYLQNDITLQWFADGMQEQVLEQNAKHLWASATKVWDGDGYYAIEFGRERTLILPYSAMENGSQVAAMVQEKSKIYDIKREKLA